MPLMEFYSGGKLHSVEVRPLLTAPGKPGPASGAARAMGPAGGSVARALHAQHARVAPLFKAVSEGQMQAVMPRRAGGAVVIATETVVVDGANDATLKRLKNRHGMNVTREGTHGKYLLDMPESGAEAVVKAFTVARECVESGQVRGSHPNFLRIMSRPGPLVPGNQPLWNHDNAGNPGVAGADVAAHAAWTVSQGDPTVRVAVLDEGVDTTHPDLKATVADERDFVDSNAHARPDGDDAHGTACAGIIVSQSSKYPGLAAKCKLVAIRIAKSDAAGSWIFDDFQTADAIDWAWRDAMADVLSNSWGGGPAVDVITNAIRRARTQGRGGLGAIVVVAAGNDDGPVSFPGNLPDVLTVGASNQWDERKSPSSRDAEGWGSNFGPSLDLVAPGVRIATTDIHGARGYSPDPHTLTFNGTSSATPHVAAAAALMLAVRAGKPALTEGQVRDILKRSADKVNESQKRDNFFGHGRLNMYSAVRLARRW